MSAASVVLPPPMATGIPLDEKARSAAGDAVVDHEPFLPDQKYHKASPPEFLTLTKEQEAAYQKVFGHFAAEDYVIPDIKPSEKGDGRLMEEEKFFLVSPSFRPFRGMLMVLRT